MWQILLTSSFILFLCSCSGEQEQNKVNTEPVIPQKAQVSRKQGCQGCHQMNLDSSHSFNCSTCHHGNENTSDKEIAHTGLIKLPSHPDNMQRSCGKCHQKQVDNATHSLHFTLKNEVNLIRFAFGAKKKLSSLVDIPQTSTPNTPLELADDLLRRRCLRCHPYNSGDRYPATARGTGCASCHLDFYKGQLVSHSFLKNPDDKQCLQCHYGNWVGSDYYGRYEHDLNDEYRTPYTTRNEFFRPFGVEYHQLLPDIHQQKGLVCVDCHRGKELMAKDPTPLSCLSCHDTDTLVENITCLNLNIAKEKGSFYLLSVGDGKKHLIPLMQHPAHAEFGKFVNCQVCHAQWAFNDIGTHLLRSDLEEYDNFQKLTVQGSFEVEKILKNNLDFDLDSIPHSMTDKISGDSTPGLWYKGYGKRRWEDIVIRPDDSGRLQVMRPILDIFLSWIDAEEEVRFDSIQTLRNDQVLIPYTPHTTGKAGLFFRDRLKNIVKFEKANTQ